MGGYVLDLWLVTLFVLVSFRLDAHSELLYANFALVGTYSASIPVASIYAH